MDADEPHGDMEDTWPICVRCGEPVDGAYQMGQDGEVCNDCGWKAVEEHLAKGRKRGGRKGT